MKSTKKPTAAQLKARANFTKMAKSGELAKKRAAASEKKPKLNGPAKGLTKFTAKNAHVTGLKRDGSLKKGFKYAPGGKIVKVKPIKVKSKLNGPANVFATKKLAQDFAKGKNKNSRTYRYIVVLYPISQGGDGKAHIVRKVKK